MSENKKSVFALPSGRKLDVSLEYSATNKNGAVTSDIEVMTIPLDQIIPDPNQPRKLFPDHVIQERMMQLENNGQKEPITVLPASQDNEGKIIYILVDGECRWRASNKSEKIEALYAQIYKGDPNNKYEIIKTQLLTNDDGSESITNFERSVTYAELVEHAEKINHDFSSPSEYVANELGKDISEFYRILKLSSVHSRVKSFCLENGIDDAKAVSSISQVMKKGGEDTFQLMEKSYKESGLNNKTTRQYFSDEAKAAKGKVIDKSNKLKKQDKKVRRLNSSDIKLVSGGIEIVTPREIFRFTIDAEKMKELLEST